MHRKDWPWEKLPQVYLNSAYISTDMQALHSHFSIPLQNPSDMDSGDTESPTETPETGHPETGHVTEEIPKRVRAYVCNRTTSIDYKCYFGLSFRICRYIAHRP